MFIKNVLNTDDQGGGARKVVPPTRLSGAAMCAYQSMELRSVQAVQPSWQQSPERLSGSEVAGPGSLRLQLQKRSSSVTLAPSGKESE